MAMGRSRSKARAGWPDNLYPNRDGFKYRHPVTRRETWMGRDRTKAFAAAKKLNALLVPSGDLVERVVSPRETIADAIAIFRRDEIPEREWMPKTAQVYESVIRRIEAGIGDQPVAITVKECAAFIRSVTESTRSRQQFRLVLGWIMGCAVQEGWIATNPVEQTRKFAFKRQRDRLTLEVYNAVWAKSPAWLQNAMDISLLTLLRREDVVSLRFSDVRDGALWVIPTKTEGSSGVKLRIALSDALAAVVARCRDAVVSPYLVHKLPEKARPSHQRAKGRDHHTQAMPEQLTREFQAVRESLGIKGKQAPTFHEIRSLGGALLQEAGWTLEQVQALMGHASEEMTKRYMEGHDAPWQPVTTGIALPDRVRIG